MCKFINNQSYTNLQNHEMYQETLYLTNQYMSHSELVYPIHSE